MTTASTTTAEGASGALGAGPRKAGLDAASAQRATYIGYALLAPYALLLLVVFFFPIAKFLLGAVDNRDLPRLLPTTTAVLAGWDGASDVPAAAFAALARDLAEAPSPAAIAVVARRLNYEKSGFRALLVNLGSAVPTGTAEQIKSEMIARNPQWAEPVWWQIIKRESGALTKSFLLSSFDLQQDEAGRIVAKPTDQSIFRYSLYTTISISVAVTLICLLLAFPVAHFLTTLPPRRVGVYMLFILLPFWTSLLVRTSAWIVMLQREGPLNQFLQWTGLTSTPLELLYNRTSVLIVMTHVLLPFMILSIYANMLAIPRDYVRAARSLGGGPISIFFRIYLPQTMPGIGAGCLLVFILALGYYVTPALVGGPRDQMLSSYIAFYTNQTINWGLASALGLVLLVVSGLSYLVITGLTRTRGPLERM